MSKRWYVVHAYSGFEKQVKRSLEDRIERAGMQEMFGQVLVPTEEVVEMKGGQKRRLDHLTQDDVGTEGDAVGHQVGIDLLPCAEKEGQEQLFRKA